MRRLVAIVVGTAASLFACGVTLTGEDTPSEPDATPETGATPEADAATDTDAPSDSAVPVDAGCPTCPTFDAVSALVGAEGFVYVGYRDGVARCDTKTCERVVLPIKGARAMAIDGNTLELLVVSGRQLHACALATSASFVCVQKMPLLPIEIETNPPAHLATAPGRLFWTSATGDELRAIARSTHALALTTAIARKAAPLVRGGTGILYAATPGIYELTDGTSSGVIRSDDNDKYKNARDLSFGAGRLGVILASGAVSQCMPGTCNTSVMYDFAGPSEATDVAVGLGHVFWTSQKANEVRSMKLDSAVVAKVSTIASPTLVTTTETHVAFVTGPHGPDVYALHFATP